MYDSKGVFSSPQSRHICSAVWGYKCSVQWVFDDLKTWTWGWNREAQAVRDLDSTDALGKFDAVHSNLSYCASNIEQTKALVWTRRMINYSLLMSKCNVSQSREACAKTKLQANLFPCCLMAKWSCKYTKTGKSVINDYYFLCTFVNLFPLFWIGDWVSYEVLKVYFKTQLLPPTKCSFATIKLLFFPTFSLSWSFKIFTEFTEPRIS